SNSTVDEGQLTFHIDLVFFALFTAFCVFTLPRMFAALSRPSRFFGSILLRGPGANQEVPSLNRDYGSIRQNPQRNGSTKTARSTSQAEESHTYDSPADLLTSPRRGVPNAGSFHVPTRVPTWLTLTHPTVVSVVNYPVLPGINFIKTFALIVMFGILCYAGFYKSNPFSDPKRSGFVVLAAFPIAIGLACKNNIFSWFSGVSYEKLCYLHRFAGLMIVLAANLHGIGFIYQWALDGSFASHLQKPKNQWAFTALGGMDLAYISSWEFVRNKSYTVFLLAHLLGFGVAALGTIQHKSSSIPYIAAGLSVYALDRLLRVARTRIATGYLTPIPSLNGGTTHVHLPGLTRGFRADQHVRVRIVDGTGFFPWVSAVFFSRSRPFSIAARPDGAGLELLVKNEKGTFTNRLFELASNKSGELDKVKDSSQPEMGLPTSKVQFVIDGPYGGSPYTMYESYSGLLLIAGGSGISHILSVLDDLLAKDAAGASRVRVIEVVWSIADPSSLTALLPALRPLLRPRPSPQSTLAIRLTIHYTRAPRGPLPDPGRLPMGLHIEPGRVDALSVLEGTVDRVLAAAAHAHGAQPTSGVLAVCCGPLDLAEEVRGAVGNISWARWRDVGGVECLSESF
ncbi:hypothetical protein K488DRAFT_26406, partial [Vararia minispora EC-137]